MIRKVQASREVYAHLMGYTDTIDKFNSRRLHMAEREWARLKANNSQECRNCHNFENMDFSQQKRWRKNACTCYKEEKTCIDCHKGIAHQLPDMSGVESGFSTEQK